MLYGCRVGVQCSCVSVSNPLDLCILDFFELGQKIFLGWVLNLGYGVIKEKKIYQLQINWTPLLSMGLLHTTVPCHVNKVTMVEVGES